MKKLYEASSTITGPLEARSSVAFRAALTLWQKLQLLAYMTVVVAASSAFVWYLFRYLSMTSFSLLVAVSMGMLVLIELIRVLQTATLFAFAAAAKDPIPMEARAELRVAVLTTIVPGKEPFNLVAKTLQAMTELHKPANAKVHVWLLDEGNDPAVRSRCEVMGVRHFSRKGLDGWNTQSGAYRAKTKHGNHNAWRRAHERDYDIVAQMDPDHIPSPDFLERTIGYFTDPTVGFVVAPQVYGNLKESWIARAAAFQAYVFHGIIQRGGNGRQAPLLIGTNHLYRVQAFNQINGYQDSIIEDHLTSMVIYGAKTPDGHRWKGVYTPDIVAVGEGPTTFTDFFNQQKRWAYGIWEIMLHSTPKLLGTMTKRQAMTFLMLQFFYPSVALSWVLSSFTTILFSFVVLPSTGVSTVVTVLWFYSILTSLGLFWWLRRFNLAEHERRDWGWGGMSLLMMSIPIYVDAAWQALRKRPLTYAVTAKGGLASNDSLQTFMPHLVWIGINLAGVELILATAHDLWTVNGLWIAEHLLLCAAPIAIHGIYLFRKYSSERTTALGRLLAQDIRSVFGRHSEQGVYSES